MGGRESLRILLPAATAAAVGPGKAENKEALEELQVDAVVCFNSGIGYQGGATEAYWLPTLRALLSPPLLEPPHAFPSSPSSPPPSHHAFPPLGPPLIFTSLNPSDQAKDIRLLKRLLNTRPPTTTPPPPPPPATSAQDGLLLGGNANASATTTGARANALDYGDEELNLGPGAEWLVRPQVNPFRSFRLGVEVDDTNHLFANNWTTMVLRTRPGCLD